MSPATLKLAVVIALLGATGLGALGLFAPALALTLGASVAIVSALWLSNLVGRLVASPRGATASGINGKQAASSTLRYGVLGLALWGGTKAVPGEIPWFLAGLSAVVVAVAIEGVREFSQASREPPGERRDGI